MTLRDGRSGAVLHWNYRGFTEFPAGQLRGEESQVTDIYLKENLIERLPDEIEALVGLRSLYLSGNRLAELPPSLGRLRLLRCLDLSGNRLTRLPAELAQLAQLKYLLLDDNELRELPLRLNRLRALRYLSVCDNKLTWLPQRPVHNYHHCEFRFWRNRGVRCLPYSLWLHMFRDRQIASLDIGCVEVSRCRLQLELALPPQHRAVQAGPPSPSSPPSLLELARRRLWRTAAGGCAEDYLRALPDFIREDLIDGPVSVCENALCKNPVFDHAYYEFTCGNILLVDSAQEVVLSAAFCSGVCAKAWRGARQVLP